MKIKIPEEIKLKKKKEKELTDTLQRVQADFENYKKRVEKEKKEFLQFANEELILKVLPILDNFELALMNAAEKNGEFVKGVELIYAQLFELLEKMGLKAIDAKGYKFDPYFHEALLQEESKEEDGVVIEVLQKGYLLHDKVLRPTKVKVSKGK